ncbi:hypothetical protein GQE99_16255 [Maritimibacter sp. DP07]|uniref:Uncharacterized protein n=1 Tax=Maritimibacter harenae TaxID=2606218 RepID=A0A845M9S2_9RHOB|nr:hypothetical protein [Maritimibacter harenae]MZR14573.1 hypothetical protein [Maritimibacter harenae]
MPNISTLSDLIEAGKQAPCKTQRQYAKHLGHCIGLFANNPPAILGHAVDLDVYLAVAPKFSKKNVKLTRKLSSIGMSPKTYKQYQSDGRRLIERHTGALEARRQLRERDDRFAELRGRLEDLVDAGLIDKDIRDLGKITALTRRRGCDIHQIDRDFIAGLRDECATSDEFSKVKRGAKLLDAFRKFPTLLDVLPEEPIGDLSTLHRTRHSIPEALELDLEKWVTAATTQVPDFETEAARKMATETYADGTIGIYRAAFRKFVSAASQSVDVTKVNGLCALFGQETLETTVISLIRECDRSDGISARTLYNYFDKIRLTLRAVGHDEEAAAVKKLIDKTPKLIEGRLAGEFMAPGVQEWCEALLADPRKRQVFEFQHEMYCTRARDALDTAAALGIDLYTYAATGEIDDQYRSIATKLLRRARMFGVSAAFAALELEGLPLRKMNVLSLDMSGSLPTFFDHRDGDTSYFRVRIPNELLKNGVAMTKRGRRLPPADYHKGMDGCWAFDILEFYLDEIRPLFGGASESQLLFPAIENVGTHLTTQTFDAWFAECSNEIGLPMTPHNFRHGYCSIEINEDLGVLPYLEVVTGDLASTLTRFYAFIQTTERLRDQQAHRAKRRRKVRNDYEAAVGENA